MADSKGNETRHLSFNVYSLKNDLFSLRPYKGDFHIHSFCSDGKESPEYVTASMPRVGMDFYALTDHGKYAPSLRAAKFAESLPTSMKVFPGEEVHLPDNPVHIINFGGSFSVNDLAKNSEENRAQYKKEVEERIKELPEDVPEPIRFQLASSEWAYDKIREGGGIAMFCHPYWRIRWRYNYISEECVNWMFKRAKFDVLELLGGYHRDESFSNNEQTARYLHEFAQAGGDPEWAIAGISDAHGCDTDLFGWFYTVLFAENCEFRSLKEAFHQKKSVAIKAINDECPEIYGELRYVRPLWWVILGALGTAGYTIIDSEALHLMPSEIFQFPLSLTYSALINLAILPWLVPIVLLSGGVKEIKDYSGKKNLRPIFASFAICLAYMLILASMRFVTNVSYVAGFRQASIPIGVLLGIVILKEKSYFTRILGCGIITMGLILMSLF